MTERRPVVFPFTGDTVGGSHVSASLLINALDRYSQSYRPVVVLHRRDGPLPSFLAERGIAYSVLAVPASERALGLKGVRPERLAGVLWRRRARRFLHASGAALVHGNDKRIHGFWGSATAGTGIPYLCHQRSRKKPGAANRLYKRASHVVSPSRYCLANVDSQLLASRTTIIPDPEGEPAVVEPQTYRAYRAALQAELGIPDGAALVGCFGTVAANKRQLLVVEALARLVTAWGLDGHVVVAGRARGDYAEAVVERARALGVAGRVHLLGYRSPIEPVQMGCDAIAAPAVGEGFGRSILEGNRLGCPVVAAASGGHLDVLRDGETGLLFAPDDPAALAHALARVLTEDELRQQLIDRGRQAIRERYSITAHVDAVTALYDRLLANGAEG